MTIHFFIFSKSIYIKVAQKDVRLDTEWNDASEEVIDTGSLVKYWRVLKI